MVVVDIGASEPGYHAGRLAAEQGWRRLLIVGRRSRGGAGDWGLAKLDGRREFRDVATNQASGIADLARFSRVTDPPERRSVTHISRASHRCAEALADGTGERPPTP